MDRALLLYDGLCGFCNATVQWMLRHDKRDCFRFAPQQTELAQAILKRHGLSGDETTVFLVLGLETPQEQVLVRSDVSVRSLLMMGGIEKFWGRLLSVVPRLFRDAGYRLVARNRFRIGGRYTTCPVPSPTDRQKFLAL